VLAPYRQPRALWRERMRWTAFYIGLVFTCIIYGFFVAVLPPAFYVYMGMPIAIIALLAIWVLPDRGAIDTGGLEWLVFAYWVGFILWPNYLAISFPGLPWISMRRLIGGPMTLVLLISLSTSRSFRQQILEVCRKNVLLTRLFIGFTVVQAVSLGVSKTPVASMMIFISNQMMWTAVLFACIPIFQKPERFQKWVRITCAMAVVTAVIGIIEWPGGHLLWRDHIPSFLKVDDASVLRTLEGQFNIGSGAYRAASTFGLSLMFAEYLAMAVPFLLHYIFEARRVRTRLILVGCYGVVLGGLICAGTRLGMVGFLVAHIMYLIIWAVRRRGKLRQSLVAATIIYGYPTLFCILVAAVLGIHRIRRVFLGGGEHQASTNARFDQWSMGWPKIFASPVFGHGSGRSGEVLGYMSPGGDLTIDSYFLTILLEFGIVGFICFFGMVIVAMVQGLRICLTEGSEDAALVGCAAISLGAFLFIKLVLSQADNHSMTFFLIGAIMVFSARYLPEKRKQHQGARLNER
jgi:hypothetical protein